MKIISPKSITNKTIIGLLVSIANKGGGKWDKAWSICREHGYNLTWIKEWVLTLSHPQVLKLYRDLIKIQ